MLVCMAFGIASRTGLFDGTVRGLLALGWKVTGPVRPGYTGCVIVSVIDKTPSRKPNRGVVEFQFHLLTSDERLCSSVPPRF